MQLGNINKHSWLGAASAERGSACMYVQHLNLILELLGTSSPTDGFCKLATSSSQLRVLNHVCTWGRSAIDKVLVVQPQGQASREHDERLVEGGPRYCMLLDLFKITSC